MRVLHATLLVASLSSLASAQLPTTSADFHQPGTQPGGLTDPVLSVFSCTFCHGDFEPEDEPYEWWSGGMMANSMRDPVFHAAWTIANQDMANAGELCLRCHTPGGFLEGRATPADGSALIAKDFDGVSCHACHRQVDPEASGSNPFEDTAILAALAEPPTSAHNGQLVLDPIDRRRGPFDLGPGFGYHAWLESPHHQESAMCATCHEVSNPAFVRVGGPVPAASDTYALDTLGTPHPTHERTDEFPLERTYTEWALSSFGAGPVEMGGRFGGNKSAVSSCQDCHMPDTDGGACQDFLGPQFRTDLPQHAFLGANSWVPRAVYALDTSLLLYPATHINGQAQHVFEDVIARNKAFLRAASDLVLSKSGPNLVARITNQAGHKLPTGYGEGRRMWLNVKFYDASDALLAERGHYDSTTATLTTADTKVYEIRHGLDAAMATTTGLPAGMSFHFVLNNTIEKDNRIPPRGFTNAAFEAGQAQVVGATYADGQYWDDTSFAIPAGAAYAVVSVYHQTTSREYIEFLRDTNTTDGKGQIAYDEWFVAGKSRPVLMDRRTFAFASPKVRPSRP